MSKIRFLGKTVLAAMSAVVFLAARADAQQIFWTESGGFAQNLGSVWTAAFDGSGKTAIATGVTRPFGIALDAARGHVYWSQDANGGQDSLVVRANLDGSNRTNLFSTTKDGFPNAQMLQLDLENGHVYWTDYFQGVKRGNLDGTGYTSLGGSGAFYTALGLDLVNNQIYYGDPTQFGVLFRMDMGGTNDVELARPMAGDHYHFNAMVVDAANGLIYYPDAGTHQIKRMNKDGSNQTVILTDSELYPYGITLGTDNTMYWVGWSARLGRANVDGSNFIQQLIAIGDLHVPFGVAVMPSMRITIAKNTPSTVTLNWAVGQEPYRYQLQRRASLTSGTWENVGAPVTVPTATDSIGATAMFYRVQIVP